MLFFGLENKKIKKEKKSIGISVIDLSIRNQLKNKIGEYEDFIKRIIIKFAKRKYKVYLFSFCEFEQDGVAIDRILKTIPEELLDNVEVVKYTNDIPSFLEKYAKVKYMVATRFHSMILSIIYGQKIYNLTYSKKIDNVINDLKLFKKYETIKNLKYETVMRMWDFKKVSNKKVEKIKQMMKNEFDFIDKI